MLKLMTRRTHRKPSCKFIVLIRSHEMFDEYGMYAEIPVGHHQIQKRQVRPPDDDIMLMNWRAVPCD